MIKSVSAVTAQELKAGFSYTERTGIYKCLFCDAAYEKGIIYPSGNYLADALKSIRLHIEAEHGSVFHMLLSEDKRNTGLTDVQKEMLSSFYSGLSDKEIAVASGMSPSTIRYQRFNFREKAKQAKFILALSELLEEKLKQKSDTLLDIHGGATMVDERYMVTGEEAEKITKSFFLSLTPPILKTFSSKEKNKLVILKIIAEQFEPSRKYTEKQVNEILKAIYHDYATIRRYLIEYGFMARTDNCSEYWLKSNYEQHTDA